MNEPAERRDADTSDYEAPAVELRTPACDPLIMVVVSSPVVC
jgi:hypothetical protein